MFINTLRKHIKHGVNAIWLPYTQSDPIAQEQSANRSSPQTLEQSVRLGKAANRVEPPIGTVGGGNQANGKVIRQVMQE